MTMMRILVVDDESTLLADLEWVAKTVSGGDVQTANGATEALKLINENDFDLVITDLFMEDKDAGLKVIAAAKEKDWSTQVLLVTAHGKPDPTGPRAIAEGAFDYCDRAAPGNYLQRLKELIPWTLQHRQKRLRSDADR